MTELNYRGKMAARYTRPQSLAKARGTPSAGPPSSFLCTAAARTITASSRWPDSLQIVTPSCYPTCAATGRFRLHRPDTPYLDSIHSGCDYSAGSSRRASRRHRQSLKLSSASCLGDIWHRQRCPPTFRPLKTSVALFFAPDIRDFLTTVESCSISEVTGTS